MKGYMEVHDVVCPKCDAGAGVPCSKLGDLVAFVGGPYCHQERWDLAMAELAEGVRREDERLGGG